MTVCDRREQLAEEIWIDERRFTLHIEPAGQGGEEYARCTGCGREILTEIGIEKLGHPSDCSVEGATSSSSSKATASDGGTDQ
jgi:hypothetical protein